MLALAKVARKSFNGMFTAKIGFPVRHLMLLSLTLTLKAILTACFMLIRSAVFRGTFNLVSHVGLPSFLESQKIIV